MLSSAPYQPRVLAAKDLVHSVISAKSSSLIYALRVVYEGWDDGGGGSSVGVAGRSSPSDPLGRHHLCRVASDLSAKWRSSCLGGPRVRSERGVCPDEEDRLWKVVH